METETEKLPRICENCQHCNKDCKKGSMFYYTMEMYGLCHRTSDATPKWYSAKKCAMYITLNEE